METITITREEAEKKFASKLKANPDKTINDLARFLQNEDIETWINKDTKKYYYIIKN